MTCSSHAEPPNPKNRAPVLLAAHRRNVWKARLNISNLKHSTPDFPEVFALHCDIILRQVRRVVRLFWLVCSAAFANPPRFPPHLTVNPEQIALRKFSSPRFSSQQRTNPS
jgi:hypothetical protein